MGMAPDKYREVFDLAQRGARAFRERRYDEKCIHAHLVVIRISQVLRERSATDSEYQPLNGLDPTTHAELALKDAEKVVTIHSNSPKAYLLKAYALILLERYHEARESLLAGLQVDPLRPVSVIWIEIQMLPLEQDGQGTELLKLNGSKMFLYLKDHKREKMQRQLAPTVGPTASGGRNRVGSAFGGVGDTIAVGRILYAGNLPIVPPNECWISARTDPIKLSIIPIGGIHIFIGETVDSDGNTLVSTAATTAAELDAAAMIRSESLEFPKEDSVLDLEISKPTLSAPEQEKAVEDQRRSTWVSQVLEKQRCHFVHFLAHTPGSASPLEGAGSEQPEGAEDNDGSLLNDLSPFADDVPPLQSEEYYAWCKEMDAAEEVDGESSPPKQVFATLAGLDEDEEEDSGKTPPQAGIPDPVIPDAPPRVRTRRTDQPPGRNLNFAEEIASEAIMRLAGENGENVVHKEILTNPLTLDLVTDPEAFEAKRQELLAEAQNLTRITSSILKDKVATDQEYEQVRMHQRKTEEALRKAEAFKAQLEMQVKRTQEDLKKKSRRRRDTIPPHNINFDNAAHRKPLATPKDNIKKAVELLANDDDKIDLDYLRAIVDTAMKQQSKADTSRRLESNPDACLSTAQNLPAGK
ncbi:hypothetical protein ACQ4PT_031946 [Festuca glaucescens]